MPKQCTLAGMCQQIKHRFSQSAARACAVVLLIAAWGVQAADIARDVRAGREEDLVPFDGYLEIAAEAILNEMPIPGSDAVVGTLAIGGHLRYQRFFADVYAESYNQFQFGYNAFSSEDWSIDLLGATSEHGVDSELNRELQLFSDRNPALMLGARATGYKDAYLIQFEALSDISKVHGGSLITASAARTWLYHNWNFHALLGARFESASSLNYQFGNSEEDATENYEAYKAKAGITLVTELGVTYPINEHFIFTTTGRWWELPSAIVNSPFITGDSYLTLSSRITFVY